MEKSSKWRKPMREVKKQCGQKEYSKQGDEQNKFIYHNETYVDT